MINYRFHILKMSLNFFCLRVSNVVLLITLIYYVYKIIEEQKKVSVQSKAIKQDDSLPSLKVYLVPALTMRKKQILSIVLLTLVQKNLPLIFGLKSEQWETFIHCKTTY